MLRLFSSILIRGCRKKGGNRYVYGLNNPVRYRDPSGNVAAVAGPIAGTIATAAGTATAGVVAPALYVLIIVGGETCIAIVTAQWCNENSDLIVEVLAEGVVTIGEGTEALGSLLTDGIVIDCKITSGHVVANASNATRISASEKAEGDSEALFIETMTLSMAIAATIVKGKEDEPTIIYRMGSGNATNLTPRMVDSTGLSYQLTAPVTGPYTVTSIRINKCNRKVDCTSR